MIKAGDILISKKDAVFFIKNHEYKIESIVYYSTVNTTLPSEYWKNKKIYENYKDINTFFYAVINNITFSSFDIWDNFYTKQEERKIKLKKLNGIIW